MKKLLLPTIAGLTVLSTAYAVSRYETVKFYKQYHDASVYPYMPSEKPKESLDYLDNHLLIQQDNSQGTVNPKDQAQTQDRTWYINCSTDQQKQKAAIAEKLLNDFYTWKWDDLLFALDRDAKVYFQMTDGNGITEELRCPANMPEGAKCTGTDGMYYGRLAYLNIIYFFKANLIDTDYRLAVKKTECVGEDLINISGHVNGSVVKRDENQNGMAVKKVWFDTPVSWTFQINEKNKVSMEQIFVPKKFVPVLFARLYAPDNSSVLETPEHEFPEIKPEVRRAFAIGEIQKLNTKLEQANDPKDLPYEIK